ncbi:uncharacterized protein LOC103569171 [Microplitis demolitor]|uniref:uncharacterized protein LOC103569171 n=1 Tax=Microplitis demolitor TaxID=69319 RepID=UPI0004CD87B7|nr:uncharacterized protein LOC103569171 [Microplitis demolitor]
MPHPCVVCGRSRMNPNNREEEYMFFGFPVNYDDRCKKWLEFCGREDLYKLTKKQLLQRMVCSKHFQEKDFLNEYLDRLNCTAVPTIYDPKQSLYNITCVLCGRYRKDPPDPDYDGTTFHHFPGEEFRCLKWLDFVGIDSYYRLTRKEILYCYICSHHFIKSQFLPGYRNRLIDNAVPMIRNPDSIDYELVVGLPPADIIKPISEKMKKFEPLPPQVLESQACAACGRSRSDPMNRVEKYKFHPFPAYEIGRCLRWCQFLGREDLLRMSPNQIRKLVLCSKHFLSGQSFQKVGPCDAVPTIKDFEEITIPIDSGDYMDQKIKQASGSELINGNTSHLDSECMFADSDKRKKKKEAPIVSSKKPFIANKPMPLAKKRGKSKRPTLITIPKPPPPSLQPPPQMIIDNRVLRKLPLPPASNNCDLWKFTQIQPNQIQPITIANNITPLTNVNSTNVKKVILPFTGNISNLGKPIPVSSLESIPPGLLIKIDLPETNNTHVNNIKPQKREKLDNNNDESMVVLQRRKRGRKRKMQNRIVNIVNEQQPETLNHSLEELLTLTKETKEDDETLLENDITEEVIIETIDENYHDESLEEEQEGQEKNAEEILDIDNADVINEEMNSHNQFVFNTIVGNNEQEQKKNEKERQQSNCGRQKTGRRVMTARTRNTLLPIRSETNRFLLKLQPQVRRLPEKARARIKCFILTMINNHL